MMDTAQTPTLSSQPVDQDVQVESQTGLPATLLTARLTVLAADVSLAEKVAAALNASYALHRDFLEWSKACWTLDEARDNLQAATQSFTEPQGEKRYFLLLRSEGAELVGCIGLMPLAEEPGAFEIGYWVSQAHTGKGLMQEGLTALMAELTAHPLHLTTSSLNIASQRLAEAVGFQRVAVLKDARSPGPSGTCDTFVYRRAAQGNPL